ncbi:hypothetical protein OKA04_09760 [Luteolibacter flavescens]|uniref:Type 4 fimbrial biogenesis protein PilX N-terminal domain-containing protein n=1 Tax=Luteolibacter flavescens TaxID=1859460 RepID=A0ABT3FN63_9BACT|nr:hypothetical protein [Luteolibacter flavescens]MCW1885012.1 hypothetical protein [Luteolibacter flavescens]
MTSRSTRPSADRGFALVVSMSLLMLLLVLAVGLLSLSTVGLRTSSHETLLQQARGNARLALQLAIGELQASAGPDQRVTAPASIRGTGPRPHLTGVWDGWKWKGEGTTPDWQKEKSDRFRGWLVSSPDPRRTGEESYATEEPAADSVRLIGGTDEVKADLVGIQGSQDQRFAWAVFDEAQKASISLPHDDAEEAATFAGSYDRSSSAARPGFAAVEKWTALADEKNDPAKLLTTGQLRFTGVEEKDAGFHDLTTGSLGLLTNAADGGWQQDLSRLFDSATLPGDFATRFLYSGQGTPLVAAPARFSGANPLPTPDPAWSLLHTHYRSFTRLTGSTPAIDATVSSVTARPTSATAASQLLRHKAFTEQQLAPVIAKAQFVFSVAFGYNADTLSSMRTNGTAKTTPADQRDEYITWIVIDPVITLWNPYNVPMRFTGARIDFYRIPLAFRLYKNGKLINNEYTKLTNAHTVEDFKTREARYYRLNILPEDGAEERILAPGEHVVFTAHNHKIHGDHEYNITGVTLRPGFHPPAGNASDAEVGGVTTQNIFVNNNGATSGSDYGKAVRTVAVKGGDRIQLEVKAERAGIDNFKETGGKEVTGFLKYYLGGGNVSRLLGGIELDYGNREEELLPHFPKEDLPTIVVNPSIPKGSTGGLPPARHALRFKEPFLIATFQEKTERDSRFGSRSWINNAPLNHYASGGIDQTEDFSHHQYELKWEVMTDWPPNSPTIEISNDGNRGYGGPGIYAQSGSEFATYASMPLAPAHSLAQLRHAPLNAGGQLPLTSQVVANSFAPPLLGGDAVRSSAGNRTYLDHSYLANNALFDSWFLSSAADHPALPGSDARTASDLLGGFFSEGKHLPNRRFLPYAGSADKNELLEKLTGTESGYREIAPHLLIDAPFNVNSTSVSAWQAVLASNFGLAAPIIEGGTRTAHEGEGLPVLRHSHAAAGDFESAGGGLDGDHAKWNGYRRLTGDQIERLAEEIVAEVKERGPFQSLAEFVNRRPGGGDLARSGALQAAIERAGINDAVLDTAYDLGTGNTADGAPGIVNQADLLTPLAPQLVVRGDTFRIRTYGEAADGRGTKVRAWAEAVVQRIPDYVDPADPTASAPASTVNQTFGRRIELVSFCWLKPEEI